MSKKENWKERALVEYAILAERMQDTTSLMRADPELNAFTKERELLDHKIDRAAQGYRNIIEEVKHQQADLRAALTSGWDTQDKTFKCPTGTATLRTTRSLQVKDKEKLIEFLTTLKKLPEFIKSFETAKLRKIKDAGLLEEEIATYTKLESISISIKEGSQ